MTALAQDVRFRASRYCIARWPGITGDRLRGVILSKLRHCKHLLTPIGETVFTPMLSIKVKYQGVSINVTDTFEAISVYKYKCPGTCSGEVYAWQGIGFDGQKSKLELIKPKDWELWKGMSDFDNKTLKKGANSVTGSLRVFPYSYKEQIPVY